MTCPKCGGQNVAVTVVQDSAKTKFHGMGCLWGMMRAMLIFCTCGLWLLIPRRHGTGRTAINNHTEAVCQNCGNRWRI